MLAPTPPWPSPMPFILYYPYVDRPLDLLAAQICAALYGVWDGQNPEPDARPRGGSTRP